MFKIKKNWMWGDRLLVMLFISIVILGGIILSAFRGSNAEVVRSIYEIYSRFSAFSIVAICFDPLTNFIRISPLIDKNAGNAVATIHLPYSKKQLFWQEFKKFLIYYPVTIIVLAAIVAFSAPISLKASFLQIFTFTILGYLLVSFFMIVIQMQCAFGIITSFAKNIKWYITITKIFFIDFCVILASVIMYELFSEFISSNAGMIVILSLFGIVSIFMFLKSWRDIEYMYR